MFAETSPVFHFWEAIIRVPPRFVRKYTLRLVSTDLSG